MRLKSAVPMMLLALLCACGSGNASAQAPLSLRTRLLEAAACSFTLDLTADYGDYTRDFSLACQAEPGVSARLTVLSPELAAGVTAEVSGPAASVSYDGTILAVEEFSTRPVSPMAAPWLLVEALSEGYLAQQGDDGGLLQARYLLGYGGKELTITVWFSGETPLRAEIADGKTTLISCEITDFSIQKKAETNEQTTRSDLGGD